MPSENGDRRGATGGDSSGAGVPDGPPPTVERFSGGGTSACGHDSDVCPLAQAGQPQSPKGAALFNRNHVPRGLTEFDDSVFASGFALLDGMSLVNGNHHVNGAGSRRHAGAEKGPPIRTSAPVDGAGVTRGELPANGALVRSIGLVNGSGQRHGAGNGKGVLGGANGLTNGNGLVNGRGTRGEAGGCARPPGRRGRRAVLAAILALAAVLAVPLASLFMSHGERGMAVDGDFSDWRGAVVLSDGADPSVANPGIDIVRYAVRVSGKSVFFYLQVRGQALREGYPEGVVTVNILIDADMSAATGFRIAGIGAELRLEIFGWAGAVRGASIHRFQAGRDGLDWAGWTQVGAAAATVSGPELEAAIPLEASGSSGSASFRALFQMGEEPSGESDRAAALVGPSGGALVVSQSAMGTGVLDAPSDDEPLLRIEFRALGAGAEVRKIVIERSGSAGDLSVGELRLLRVGRELSSGRFAGGRAEFRISLSIPAGGREELELRVALTSRALPGETFGAGLAGHDAVALARGTATVLSPSCPLNYISAPPPGIVIDGAFADWEKVPFFADPQGDCRSSGVDLVQTRALKDPSCLSILTRVDGSILGGPVNLRNQKRPHPSPPSPGPSRPPESPASPAQPIPATDTVQLFIDTDGRPDTGYAVPGVLFGADVLLEVTGSGGRILGTSARRWSEDATWLELGSFAAAKDTSRMEIQAPLSLLGLTNGSAISLLVLATEWTGMKDIHLLPVLLRDPLQLGSKGEVLHSADGLTWKYQSNITDGDTYKDLCSDASGYVYAINRDGEVYKSTGNWSSWTKVVSSTSDYFVALAVNGSTFYGLSDVGNVYAATKDSGWSLQGDVGSGYDYEDICSDGNGSLYVIRSRTNETAYVSRDGGKSWSAFGNCSVGSDSGTETNVAVVYGRGWNGTEYLFILQSDGEVRYDTDGNTTSPWNRTDAPPGSEGKQFADIDIDRSSGLLWTLTTEGKVYTFSFNSTPPCGTWNTSLGSAGDVMEFSAAAIAVNLVPEFRDVSLPVAAVILLFAVFRVGQRRRGTGGCGPMD
ncbi:MAG: hypothetical protein QXW06_02560 [Thermoplasmata archaeon]